VAGSGRPQAGITLLKLFGIMIVAAVLVAGVLLPYVGGLGYVAGAEANKFNNTVCTMNTNTPAPQKTIVYANDGKTVLATFFEQDRQPVALNTVPKFLVQALVATEDRRFYSHHGVDMRGLIRSAFSTSNGDTQGGSTLTMQYVKQVRYYQAGSNVAAQAAAIDQTLNRKLEDAKCALDLEKVESKDEILDNYLNIAFYGENSYSIESAAQTYFGKDVSKLDLPEAAMLVGLVQAPSAYDPFQHPQAAKDRRNQVIQNLVDVKYITAAQAATYEATPLHLATASAPPVSQGCANANSQIANTGFFCDYLHDWLIADGITEPQLTQGGLRIVSTLSPTIQNSAQQKLSAIYPAKSPSTAILPVVDPKTGDVLAMVTNKTYGYAADGGHTVAHLFTDATAQGASTYKYFALIAALKAGAQPDMAIRSTNAYLPSSCPTGTNAKPVGNAEVMPNTLTLAQAMAMSSNTYFVALLDKFFEDCDLSPVVKTALSLGMTALNAPSGNGNLSVASNIISKQSYVFTLGSGPATSPLQLTSAYAAAANDGIYCTAAPVKSIKDDTGASLPVKRTPCVSEMSPQVASTALQVMAGDSQQSFGTSFPEFQPYYASGGSVVSGKTGTQNADNPTTENSAAWYVGVTPDLTAAMAIYNPASPSSPLLGVPGAPDGQASGSTAAGIWLAALQPSLATQPPWTLQDPNAVSGSIPVPNIIGLSVADATTKLAAAGFKAQDFGDLFDGTRCGSPLQNNAALLAGYIAYFTPAQAVPGSTVTFCQSDGVSLLAPIPPKPTPPPTPTNTATTGASGPGGASTPGGAATTPPASNPRRGGPTKVITPPAH
jgi:membrane peptidoglycan carboxypeptidase